MGFSGIKRLLLGEPLSNEMAAHERIPKWKALAVLSSDALSSVAYATEEILIPLAGFSAAAVVWSMPIALGIGILLIIITLSYRQTIQAYPSGGGAYIVAKENLGVYAGLIAAASLLIDYVLTVAVSVASGVENITSAFPILDPHKVGIGGIVIVVIMLFNLRGLKESASIFALPTYFFILSFVVMIVAGIWNFMTGAVVPAAPIIHASYPEVPLFLVLTAFSSGCTALTGVEAISNGVPVFKEPSAKNAKATMVWMGVILGSFFLGITLLSHLYGLVPKAGETAVSLLAHAVFGDRYMYYVVQASTALILLLAANTSYADFPRLSSLLAKDRFLPRQLAILGDRLVFSNGILLLSLGAIFLVVFFRGDTHNLIPLYAIGVFLSFTLSQAGMVVHHIKEKAPGWWQSLFFNGLGAVTTFIVLMVHSITKFKHGAWIVVVLIPFLVLIFREINQHYLSVGKQLSKIDITKPAKFQKVKHTAIIPISGIHQGVYEAIQYALSISDDVRACYVDIDPAVTERIRGHWDRWAPNVPFVVLPSPYRSVIGPLLNYIDDVEKIACDDVVTVVVPEFVTERWWHRLLHNQTAIFIRAALAFRKGKVVTTVRYHLGDK